MGELDLQPPFRRRRPFPENLQDQAGAVDDLGVGDVLQARLLDRGERRVDDQQAGLLLADQVGNGLGLPLAEQASRPRRAQLEGAPVDNFDADGLGEPLRLVEPCLDRAQLPALEIVGKDQDGTFAAGDSGFVAAIEDAQLDAPSASLPAACSPARSSACAG